MTRNPPAGTEALSGKRYFLGLLKSSVKNQPPILAALAVGLWSSTLSTCGGSVWVSASLISMPGIAVGGGSAMPGEPPARLLGRQLNGLPQVSGGAFSLTMTSEKPRPSVTGYQELSKRKSSMGSSRAPTSERRSPELSRFPEYSPAMLLTAG